MISFIVIGKNEGWKLTKCFKSVFNFVELNKISNYEVIYIDSKSTDDSIERAKAFDEVKVFQITGECNAAIARNIGAKESIGDILYFIDGDMEIKSDFYNVAFDKSNKLIYPFISGGLINYNYDNNWNLISKSNYGRNSEKDKYEYTTGGIFIINKELWNKVGGMQTKYMRNQDLDLGLRLSKIGYPVLRKKEIIANHHTIPYNDNKRTWKLLFNKSELYPMVLFRDHISNQIAWKMLIFENYTLIFLILAVIINLQIFCPIIFTVYVLLLLFKSWNSDRLMNLSKILQLPKLFLRDISRFFAFFLFYPKSPKIEYKRIINV